jgi:hypothetical protein
LLMAHESKVRTGEASTHTKGRPMQWPGTVYDSTGH